MYKNILEECLDFIENHEDIVLGYMELADRLWNFINSSEDLEEILYKEGLEDYQIDEIYYMDDLGYYFNYEDIAIMIYNYYSKIDKKGVDDVVASYLEELRGAFNGCRSRLFT